MKVLKSLCLLAVSLLVISCGGSSQKATAQSDSSQSLTLTTDTTQPEASPLILNPITVSTDGKTMVVLQTVVSAPGQFFIGYGEVSVLPPTAVQASTIVVAYQGYPQILGAPFVAPANVTLLVLPRGQQTFVPIASSTLVPGQSLQASGSFPVGTRLSVETSGGLNNNLFPQQCMDFCGWQYNVTLN